MTGSDGWLEGFLLKRKAFSERDPWVESVIMVGSYAKGTNRENSDLDLLCHCCR